MGEWHIAPHLTHKLCIMEVRPRPQSTHSQAVTTTRSPGNPILAAGPNRRQNSPSSSNAQGVDGEAVAVVGVDLHRFLLADSVALQPAERKSDRARAGIYASVQERFQARAGVVPFGIDPGFAHNMGQVSRQFEAAVLRELLVLEPMRDACPLPKSGTGRRRRSDHRSWPTWWKEGSCLVRPARNPAGVRPPENTGKKTVFRAGSFPVQKIP